MSNKRVHEIAKERGLPAKDVIARLKAAGVDVKAASSSVDEEVASRVLANGGQTRSGSGAGSATKAKPAADKPRAKSADAAKPAAKSADRRAVCSSSSIGRPFSSTSTLNPASWALIGGS